MLRPKKRMQERLETLLEEFKDGDTKNPNHLLHTIERYITRYGQDSYVKAIHDDYKQIR